MLGTKESAFVNNLLKDFYSSIDNIAPRNIDRREFGFGDFERKISYRHYKFKDEKELKNYLSKNAPAFVSYSSAEYRIPDGRPMENKGWIGSDLLFDIDASDLGLPCKLEHGSSWVCQKCFDAAKFETVKLVEEFLVPDFGFSEKEISINFSGNRGYHIHINNENTFKLDGDARKSIINYITGNNIELNAFFPTLGRRGVRLEGPKPNDYGWGGKFANGVIRVLNSGTSSLMELGIDKKDAEMLTRKRAEIILGISTGNWDKVNIPKKAEFWSNILKGISIKQGDLIDKNVSTDKYHLIRLPGTIHGDTGLVAKKLKSLKALESFEPMNSTIAFDDKHMKIKTAKVPKFIMNGIEFGPYDNANVELPTYAATYLILKRVALMGN
ncbi:MAG: DNA primase catalytic subunit PriS [Candidatus Micrarchaeaceae archaeon]